ncbi:MAG: hypothetical protein ACRYF5_16595 [Janthinobacterium lividum]
MKFPNQILPGMAGAKHTGKQGGKTCHIPVVVTITNQQAASQRTRLAEAEIRIMTAPADVAEQVM